MTGGPAGIAVELAVTLTFAAVGAALLGRLNLRGTVSLVPAVLGLVAGTVFPAGHWLALACLAAGVLREHWRREDIKKGHDQARRARTAIGLVGATRAASERRKLRQGTLRRDDSFPLGTDASGRVVWLPLGHREGRHTLLIGATGAGKTTTLLTAAHAHLDAGMGLIAVDAKGDPSLVARLREAAERHGKVFRSFALVGDSDRWNPLAHGTPSENADKLIAAEDWTEPHYQRFYQRYLLTVFSAIAGRGSVPDLPAVVELLDPGRLAIFARELANPEAEARVDRHLAELTDREYRDLAGLRNRIALLTEGDHGHLLRNANETHAQIDLLAAVQAGQVVVFSFNSSRYPETTRLLASTLIQDLTTVTGILESDASPHPAAVVLVDEFSALGVDMAGLFQRARSARLSLLLATQELADLRREDPTLQDQVLGNVETTIAHRQNVPASAELVAELAGTSETWIHTFQTGNGLPGQGDKVLRGSRRRGHEFVISPDTIKRLRVGEAVVIAKNPHAVHLTQIRGQMPIKRAVP